jgi:alkylhydroperoxidase family enzyme
MAFFSLVPEDRLTPQAQEQIAIARKRQRTEHLRRDYYAMAAHPPLLRASVQAMEDLIPIPNRFGTVQFVASMLIAHAKGCGPCFDGSRGFLLKIGYDGATLDLMCQMPAALPLSERDRLFVDFTLRVARDPGGLTSADFEVMKNAGFSKDEILEMIGVAAFWNFQTTVASALDAGLRDDQG